MFENLAPWDEDSGDLNVIIETPKDRRNKYAYDEDLHLFVLKTVLPVGSSFPYDFGCIPNTEGGDGDPLDVLVLMDEPAFPGCLVRCRLLGVIEAEQTERDGRTERNDRIVAVAAKARLHDDVDDLSDLNEKMVDEIEHFFHSYNEAHGKRFKPLGRSGPESAKKLVEEGINRRKQSTGSS